MATDGSPNFEDLIVLANNGNSSYAITNDTQPALFVDASGRVGINAMEPTAQLEIANTATDDLLRLRRGGTGDTYADLKVSTIGDLTIRPNAVGSKVSIAKNVDIANHDGSTTGLKLGGTLVTATAQQLNYNNVTPGMAEASKTVVLDANKNITNINSVTATTIAGTVQTPNQPNITSIGTLSALTVTGSVTAGTFNGFIQTADQPNITSIGTLSSLSVSGALSAGMVTGAIQTPAQPKITSIGELTSLAIAGSTITTEFAYLAGAVSGTASASHVLVTDAAGSIAGINSLSATSLVGTIQTSLQPNITSVGTLASLTVGGDVAAATLTGVLQTGVQPKITSVGNLTSLTVAGSTISSEAAYLAGVVPGTASISRVLVLDGNKSISGIGTLSANRITGLLQTASQPNITSIGSLTSVNIAGSVISAEAAYLSGAVAGVASSSKLVVLNATKSITGINSLGASQLTGTLQTAAQPNITSLGALTGLTVTGATTLSSTTDATSVSSGALRVAGGVGIAKNLYVGSGIYGTIKTAAQTTITSLGTLTGLNISGNLAVTGTITVNGVSVLGGGGGSGTSAPDYVLDITPGAAISSKALVLNSAGSITGVSSLSATSLWGTLQTAAQPNITSVGTLSNLVATGRITAANLTGTIQTSAQPNITSVGTLAGLTVNGAVRVASSLNATDATNGGALTIAGGLAVAQDTYIGGNMNVLGSLWVNGIDIGGSGGGISSLAGVTPGTATAGLALVLDSNKSITGINSLGTKDLQVSGTLQSYAGVDWANSTTLDPAVAWTDIAWSDKTNMYVATSTLGTTSSIAQSLDYGQTWSYMPASISGAPLWSTVCYSPRIDVFVALAKSGTYRNVSLLTGGTSWTYYTWSGDACNWEHVYWSNEMSRFMAVASSGTTQAAWSANGQTWTMQTTPVGGWRGSCYSPSLDKAVAVGSSGTLRTMASINLGVTWTAAASANDANRWASVCWSPPLAMFVAVAESGTNRVMWSTNGTTWTGVPSADETAAWKKVKWAPELQIFVAVASSGASVVMTSMDGIIWTARTANTESGWNGLEWISKLSKFAAVATTGSTRLMTSTHACNSSITLVDTLASSTLPPVASGISVGATVQYKGPSHKWAIGSTDVMHLTSTGLGIGVANPSRAIDINSSSGQCLRLRGPNNYSCDFDVNSNGYLSISGDVKFTNTTASGTTGTGAIVVSGGVGIGGNLNVTGAVSTSGAITVTDATASTGIGTGSVIIGGGVSVTGTLHAGTIYCSYINSTSTLESTGTTSGSLVTRGGLGVAGKINCGGSVTIVSTTDSTSTTTGALIVNGGVGIATKLTVGGAISVTEATPSTSTTTGALTIAGGMGVSGAVYIGGTLSTSACTVSGGVAVAGNSIMDGNVVINSTTASTSTTTGALVVAGGVGIGGSLNVNKNVTIMGMAAADSQITYGRNTSNAIELIVPGDGAKGESFAAWDAVRSGNFDRSWLYHQSGVIVFVSENLIYWTNDNFVTRTLIPYSGTVQTHIITYPNYNVKYVVVEPITGDLFACIRSDISASSRRYILTRGTIAGGFSTIDVTATASQTGTIEDTMSLPSFASAYEYIVHCEYTASYSWLVRVLNGVADTAVTVSYRGVQQLYCSGFDRYIGTDSRLANKKFTYTTNSTAYTAWTNATSMAYATTYPITALAYNDILNVVVGSSRDATYYSLDGGITWLLAITQVFPHTIISIPGKSAFVGFSATEVTISTDGKVWQKLTNATINFPYVDSVSYGITIDNLNRIMLTTLDTTTNTYTLQRTQPMDFGSYYGLTGAGGFMKYKSKTGYEWYTTSTIESDGIKLMSLDETKLSQSIPHVITSVEPSVSTTTGAFIVSGGVGIAGNLNVGGNGVFGGTVTQASDIRLKTDVNPLPIEKAKALYNNSVVTYKWKNKHMDQSQQVGVIAQDLASAGLDNLVRLTPNTEMEEGDDARLDPAEKQWAVNYAGISAYNMKMIAYLIQENKTLKERLSALETNAA